MEMIPLEITIPTGQKVNIGIINSVGALKGGEPQVLMPRLPDHNDSWPEAWIVGNPISIPD